jgi:lipopolysaccharide export system protein LptA
LPFGLCFPRRRSYLRAGEPEQDAHSLTRFLATRSLASPCARGHLRSARLSLRVWSAVCFTAASLAAGAACGEVQLPPISSTEPVTVSADLANNWKQGSNDVWLLRGRVTITQGPHTCRAQDGVVWIKQGEGTEKKPTKLIAYLEGDVQIEAGRLPEVRSGTLPRGNDKGWLGRFYTIAPVRINTPRPRAEPPVKPAFYENALAARDPTGPGITRTQFTPKSGGAVTNAAQSSTTQNGAAVPPPYPGAPPGTRWLRIFQRGESPPHVEASTDAATNQSVIVMTGGVQVLIDGIHEMGQLAEQGQNPASQLDILADKIMVWTAGHFDAQAQDQYQNEEIPFEVYLEGNVVFRQGDRVIYAERMYFDVKHSTGTVLEAEIMAPVPKFGGLIRLKADMVRQVDENTFYARRSYLTTSRMSRPSYRVQSSEIKLFDRQIQLREPFGFGPKLDPQTGEPMIEHEQMVSAKNNLFYVGPVPVFYVPRFTTNLEEPSTLLTSAYFQYDKIFGVWTEAEVDAFQLLGLENPPEGLDWTFTVSDLTKRGFGGGTDLLVNRQEFLGFKGPLEGNIDVWGLQDHGLDNLGRTRINIKHPEAPNLRGRYLGQFRQQLENGWKWQAEFAQQSDYNFLESYYEAEFDQRKDETTNFELKKLTENRSFSVYTQVRLNPFFTQTNWLPRLDHFAMGQSLLNDRFTFYEHSNIGYAQFERIRAPIVPQDLQNFNYLPWETTGSHQGDRVATRNEIDAPFELGPVKVVPYAEGELAQWGQNLNNQDVGRVFGQVGMRASILFWAANPTIDSELFNVHGLAHKVVFDVDASAADANRDYTTLTLYDPIDDNAQYRFTRRFMSLDYGGVLPARFDPRTYDFRSGIQNFVASPTTEIAGRLDAVRLGMRHRWQTKRGPIGHRRIVDYVVLDSNIVYFPNPNRDNFGQAWGLAMYDFRWHVGDRLTVLSDGGFDFFAQGQRTYSIGATLSRPPRINLYLGFRSLNGPFTYNVVQFTQSYQLSPKWMASASTSVALHNPNIGENFSFTRVGESFVTSMAFYVDGGKNNTGVNFMVQPRFLGQNMLRRIGASGVPMSNPNEFE